MEAKCLCLYNHRNQVISDNQPQGPLHVCNLDFSGCLQIIPRRPLFSSEHYYLDLFLSIICDQYVKLKFVNSTTTTFRGTRTHLWGGLHFFRGSDANIDVWVKLNPGYSRSLKTRLTPAERFSHHYWQRFWYSVKAVVRDIFTET